VLLHYLVKYVLRKSPCSRIAWTNYHTRLKPTAMQNLCTENYSRKNTCIVMWVLFNSLKRRYLPINPQNNWLCAAIATKKNTSQQNPFAHHQRSVTVSDDVSWQVKIGLHQFDNCLSQVKTDVTTAVSCHTQISGKSLSFSRSVPRCTEHVRQSAFLPVTSPNVDWF